MNKLDNHANWNNVDAMMSASKVTYHVDKHTKKAQGFIKKLVDKHAKKLEGGTVQRDENGMPVWEDEEAFAKDHSDLMLTKFPIKVKKLLAEEVVKAGLSPRELRACSLIIADWQELGDNEDEQQPEETVAE